ncbi:MFS transporter [Nocardioides speluncae]|uniref:MFS transporter n=1 Tax=Nocardioides speluncae TaxID=2670337 RepID=UPI000D69462F|nr:MFS transporter [Nocardioides speluncae]
MSNAEAPPPPPLGRQFNLLWTGQSVSMAGDRITAFIVPTVMVFLLGASAFDIGLVGMAQYLAIPILGLLAGALIDRWNVRRTLIACDLVRLVAVLVIPLAYWLDVLSVALVFVCVAVISSAQVFFNVGYSVSVITSVDESQRVRAYSRLEASRTTAEVGGPSIAGLLWHLAGVWSLVLDALSYVFSASCLSQLEDKPRTHDGRSTVMERLTLGLRHNWADPVLRRTMVGTLILNSGGPIFVTLLPVLAYQGHDMSAGTFGTVMSVAALGAVGGAIVAPRISRRLGVGRLTAWSVFCHCVVGLGILAALVFPVAVVLTLTLAAYGFCMVHFNISISTVRQPRINRADQAIVYSAFRTVTWGVIPLAAFVGGLFVELLTSSGMSVLSAANLVMSGGTVMAAFAFVPLWQVQRLSQTPSALRDDVPTKEAQLEAR